MIRDSLRKVRAGTRFAAVEVVSFWLGFSWAFSNQRKWQHTIVGVICEAGLLALSKDNRDGAARVIRWQDRTALDQLDRLRAELDAVAPSSPEQLPADYFVGGRHVDLPDPVEPH